MVRQTSEKHNTMWTIDPETGKRAACVPEAATARGGWIRLPRRSRKVVTRDVHGNEIAPTESAPAVELREERSVDDADVEQPADTGV